MAVPKVATALPKVSEESKSKKMADYSAKVDATTDLVVLRSQLALEEAKVAAIKAQIKATMPAPVVMATAEMFAA